MVLIPARILEASSNLVKLGVNGSICNVWSNGVAPIVFYAVWVDF